jgi:hypothetical protein
MLRIDALRCSPGRAQPELAALKHPAAFSLPGCAAQRQRQGVEYSRQRDWPTGVSAQMTGRECGVIGAS